MNRGSYRLRGARARFTGRLRVDDRELNHDFFLGYLRIAVLAVSLDVVSVKLTGTDEDMLGNSWITQQLLTVLVTVIRESAMLAECPSSGNTMIKYRPGRRSARDFFNPANDFMEGRVM